MTSEGKYVIAHASATTQVLHLVIGDYEVELYRTNAVHREIIANLYLPFDPRGRVFPHELRGMEIRAEIEPRELDETADLLCAWPDGFEPIYPAGPSLVERATAALFRWKPRRVLGRKPTLMKAVRTTPDGDAKPCADCGAPSTQTHHVTPRADWGEDEEGNLVELCDACHVRRHRAGGPVVLKATWYDAEVTATTVGGRSGGDVVRLAIVSGPLAGRCYNARWLPELGYGPAVGRVYHCFLAKTSAGVEVRSVEPSKRESRPIPLTQAAG